MPGPGATPAAPTPALYPAQPAAAILASARSKIPRRIAGLLIAATGILWVFKTGDSVASSLILAASVALGLLLANYGRGPTRREVRQRLTVFQDTFTRLHGLWSQQAGDSSYRKKVKELETLWKEHLEMPSFRVRQLAALTSGRRDAQRQRFLDQHRIARVKIPGISHDRTATLQSFGIETAWDVNPRDILRIPGFGPKLTQALLEWRRSVEARFVFDPSKGVDPADIASMDRDIAARQDQIRQALLAGAGELERIKHQIFLSRQALAPQLEAAAKALAQALADLKALT